MVPSLRYLNTVLTIIAVLLTLNLWTLGAGGPSHAMTELATPAQAAVGHANPGHQRKQMIDLLKRQVQQTEQLSGLFQSGKARVSVASAPKEPGK